MALRPSALSPVLFLRCGLERRGANIRLGVWIKVRALCCVVTVTACAATHLKTIEQRPNADLIIILQQMTVDVDFLVIDISAAGAAFIEEAKSAGGAILHNATVELGDAAVGQRHIDH